MVVISRLHLLFLASVVAFSACSHAGGADTAPHRDLVIASRQEPVSLNPLYLEGPTGYAISELLYSYLTNYDSNGTVVPDVATEIPSQRNGGISRDGTTVMFHLRQNLRWQDGAPLTARDVVFTYEAIVNPANTVPSRYGYDQIASCSAPNPYTVILRLKHPFSPIVANFFGGDSNYPILPAHLLAQYRSLDKIAFNRAPVGSGPYKLDRWETADHLSVVSNADYREKTPRLHGITLRFIHDATTTVNQLLTGEVDAAFFVDISQMVTLRRIPRHRVVVTPVPYFYALGFNMADPAVGHENVRRAFALALDRRAIVQKITHGIYDAQTGPRGLFTWAFDPSADPVKYDPKTASRLLSADGWIPGPDGVRTKAGKQLHLQLSYPTGSLIMTQFVTAIAAAEHAIGIDVSLKGYVREQYMAPDGPVMQGHFQIEAYDYQSTYDPDASWLLSCNQWSPHGFNDARYCNHRVDALLRHAAVSYDRGERRRDYEQVQQQIARDVPYLFLCQISEVDVIPDWLQGYARPLLSPYNSSAHWRGR